MGGKPKTKMFRAVSVPAKIPTGTSQTHTRKEKVEAKHLVTHWLALASICCTGLTDCNVGHVSECKITLQTQTQTHTYTALYDAKPKIMTYSQLPNTD